MPDFPNATFLETCGLSPSMVNQLPATATPLHNEPACLNGPDRPLPGALIIPNNGYSAVATTSARSATASMAADCSQSRLICAHSSLRLANLTSPRNRLQR